MQLKRSQFTTCDCDLPEPGEEEILYPFSDIASRADAEKSLTFTRSVQINCYNSRKWQMLGKDGKQVYNFLDYMGTTQLAYDLETLRRAVGAPKMSILGYSYGTKVGAVYAAIFPGNVYRLLLNGNIQSAPTTIELGTNAAAANQQAINRLLYICDEKVFDGEPCSLGADPYTTVNKMLKKAFDGEITVTKVVNHTARFGKSYAPATYTYTMSQDMVFSYFAGEMYDNTGTKWIQAMGVLTGLCPEDPAIVQ
jgi:pimeloyl-ACP methyl ester carboxylesterase